MCTLAACGGGQPRLARSDAAPLITLSNRIARERPCAQARDIRALQSRAVSLVNAKRVPAELQESFLSGVNALSARLPVCVPAVAPAPVSSSPPDSNPPAPSRGKPHGHSHGKGTHGHGHGHDK